MTNKDLSEKLRRLEEVLGLTPQEMANLGGCSRSTYYRYRSGESVPDLNFFRKILENENRINADWLLKDRGPVLHLSRIPGIDYSPRLDYDQDNMVKLPLFHLRTENELVDGEGQLPVEDWDNPSSYFPIAHEFLTELVKSAPSQLFAMTVQCDSMSPMIKPGSMVIVDQSRVKPSIDGVFVIRFDDVLRMKVLQRIPGKQLLLSTINDKFDDVTIRMDDFEDFRIMGRVVWVGTPL